MKAFSMIPNKLIKICVRYNFYVKCCLHAFHLLTFTYQIKQREHIGEHIVVVFIKQSKLRFTWSIFYKTYALQKKSVFIIYALKLMVYWIIF